MRRRTHHLVILSTLIAASTVVVTAGIPEGRAEAATFNFTVSPGQGGVGIDAVYERGGGGGAYDVDACNANPNAPQLQWGTDGQLRGVRTVADTHPTFGALTQVRFELYPGPCGTHDGWNDQVGGVHIDLRAPFDITDLGAIRLPVRGAPNVVHIVGDVVSSAPVPSGRVSIDLFQITTAFPDAPAPLQSNGRIQYGAFGHSENRGNRWSGGLGWSGRYVMFIRDTATNRHVTATTDIRPGAIPTIDLDALCFGFDVCTYDRGGPGANAGRFHPTPPTRILDTRRGLGIANGPIRTGDGRNTDPNPLIRLDQAANHTLKVTGRYGVPASGVSAVLLNVTAVDAPAGDSWLSLLPTPQRVGDLFNDQASYREIASTSNLNVMGPSAVPNLVLARVGAGGTIRLHNSFGPTHLIADLAGWFDSGGSGGGGFRGVVPARVLDSRTGLESPRSPFQPGESRSVRVAGVAGIPSNAASVVVNITATSAARIGYLTGYPDGRPAPEASNLNVRPGLTNAVTAVVQVGSNGHIRFGAADTSVEVIVDVLGSFGPGGGAVTAIAPQRIVDSRGGLGTPARPLGPGETREVQVAGRGGVPTGATAVIANLTGTAPSWFTYLTAWPSGNAMPPSSNLNLSPGATVPNLVMLSLGTGGRLSLFNESGTTHVLLDVMGYVR